MIKKFYTVEFIKTDYGQVRIVIKILERDVKEKIFRSVDKALNFLQKEFSSEEVKKDEK